MAMAIPVTVAMAIPVTVGMAIPVTVAMAIPLTVAMAIPLTMAMAIPLTVATTMRPIVVTPMSARLVVHLHEDTRCNLIGDSAFEIEVMLVPWAVMNPFAGRHRLTSRSQRGKQRKYRESPSIHLLVSLRVRVPEPHGGWRLWL